mmetsp:Transcript_3615/g.8032  ORF Transcript_3615/g.8032 Transcript_3615/m.8032 type:complete len:92 (+) Transcript_3615:225-500(+)
MRRMNSSRDKKATIFPDKTTMRDNASWDAFTEQPVHPSDGNSASMLTIPLQLQATERRPSLFGSEYSSMTYLNCECGRMSAAVIGRDLLRR